MITMAPSTAATLQRRRSKASENDDAVYQEDVFVQTDKGIDARIQSDGYMIRIRRQKVVLPHQRKGKVTNSF